MPIIHSEKTMLVDGEVNQFVIGLTKPTLDRLLRLPESRRGDAISLYVFYCYTARWQCTPVVRATNTYVERGLGWGEQKTRAVKKVLLDLGLIETLTIRDDTGRVTEWRVKVRYIAGRWNPNTHLVDPDPDANSQTVDFARGGEIKDKEETGIAKIKRRVKKFEPSVDFLDDALQSEWAAFQVARKKMGHPLTDEAKRRIIEDLNIWFVDIPERIEGLRNAIESGWRKPYPPRRTLQDQKPKLPFKKRDDYINGLNRRKAELLHKPQTAEVQRELARIQAQLYKL